MFDKSYETLDCGKIARYRLLSQGASLSYAQVLSLLQDDALFRSFLTDLFVTSSFSGYRWETPPVCESTVSQPFEFVLLDYPSFASRRTDSQAYRSYFTTDDTVEGVVRFKNLSGDAILIVPSPRTDRDAYGHLASFLRLAPESQIHSLWQTIGQTVVAQLTDEPLWLSTAGGGVAWLHVRLDSTPKYYGFNPYTIQTSTKLRSDK